MGYDGLTVRYKTIIVEGEIINNYPNPKKRFKKISKKTDKKSSKNKKHGKNRWENSN